MTSLYKILPLVLLMFVVACSDNDTGLSEPDLYRVGDFTDGDFTVIVYADRPLHVGFNTLYLEVLENGDQYRQAHIHFTPLMNMSNGHSHACPHNNPPLQRNSDTELFQNYVIFTMPSGDMGSWELQFEIHDLSHSEVSVEGIIPVDVDPSGNVKTFTDDEENSYILTLIEPSTPESGSADLRVSLHRRIDMMNYPPVTSADILIRPWMESMGHGSSNNEHPTHSENGFYEGTVNFSMSGDWRIYVNTAIGDQLLHEEDAIYFDLNVE